EMSACRRTHDTDALRVELPLACFGSNQSNCPSSILQHGWMAVAPRSKPIFEDECRNALFIEPKGIVLSFMRRESAIAAARQDYHDRAARFLSGCKKRR